MTPVVIKRGYQAAMQCNIKSLSECVRFEKNMTPLWSLPRVLGKWQCNCIFGIVQCIYKQYTTSHSSTASSSIAACEAGVS